MNCKKSAFGGGVDGRHARGGQTGAGGAARCLALKPESRIATRQRRERRKRALGRAAPLEVTAAQIGAGPGAPQSAGEN